MRSSGKKLFFRCSTESIQSWIPCSFSSHTDIGTADKWRLKLSPCFRFIFTCWPQHHCLVGIISRNWYLIILDSRKNLGTVILSIKAAFPSIFFQRNFSVCSHICTITVRISKSRTIRMEVIVKTKIQIRLFWNKLISAITKLSLCFLSVFHASEGQSSDCCGCLIIHLWQAFCFQLFFAYGSFNFSAYPAVYEMCVCSHSIHLFQHSSLNAFCSHSKW